MIIYLTREKEQHDCDFIQSELSHPVNVQIGEFRLAEYNRTLSSYANLDYLVINIMAISEEAEALFQASLDITRYHKAQLIFYYPEPIAGGLSEELRNRFVLQGYDVCTKQTLKSVITKLLKPQFEASSILEKGDEISRKEFEKQDSDYTSIYKLVDLVKKFK